MGLAEAIHQGLRHNTKYKCAVQGLIEELDPEDGEALRLALEKLSDGSATFSMAWLHRLLLEQGHKIGASTMSRHINGACACESK